MARTTSPAPTPAGPTARDAAEVLDVVVVGAGISGIGAAQSVRSQLPHASVAVLEGRGAVGGTWDLFRYPGIRSDSDLHTFGYEFKPWRHRAAIADAPLIREYLAETVEEFDLTRLIRFHHRVVAAAWSSEEARWTLTVEVGEPGGAVTTTTIRARWVFAATGYYRYDEGYTPHFEGRDDFRGPIVHPQHWPEDLDYAGRRVIVIGSGATAVTIVPAMLQGEGAAAHVTMLQRTPTYVMSWPRVDGLAVGLTRVFGQERGYRLTRLKNIWVDQAVVKAFRRFPRAARALVRSDNVKHLPAGFDVDTHFNPPYDPWDQRLCLAPDGDFFDAISAGGASVVTAGISRFTETGVLLDTGEELQADVIVTATGLNMQLFGGIPLTVDGREIDLHDCVAYRGMMLSGLPNWAMAIGYTTSSWTLKVSLMCRFFVSLVRHMEEHGFDTAVAVAEEGMDLRPVMDISSGYARRGAPLLPRQGSRAPWEMKLGYPEDAKALRGPIADPALRFSSPAARAAAAEARETVDA